MKIIKKVLAIILVISMLSSYGLNVGAVDGTAPTICVGSDSLLSGETVVVPVSIENNPNIGAANIQILYDEENLEIQSISARRSPAYGGFYGSIASNPSEGTVTWANAEGFAEDDVLFWITFSAKEAAQPGDYEISIEKIADTANLIADVQGNAVSDIQVSAGTITVEAPKEPVNTVTYDGITYDWVVNHRGGSAEQYYPDNTEFTVASETDSVTFDYYPIFFSYESGVEAPKEVYELFDPSAFSIYAMSFEEGNNPENVTFSELKQNGYRYYYTVTVTGTFEGVIFYSGVFSDGTLLESGCSATVSIASPELVYRFMRYDNGQFQEDVEYNSFWGTVKGSSSNVKVYFFDGENYNPLSVNDLSVSNAEVVSLEAIDGANYITMNIADFGDSAVTYTVDGITYSIAIRASLPPFGYYTSTTPSEETFLPHGFTVTKDSKVFYFVGLEGCTISDFTWEGEGVTAELSEDGSHITFTVDKDAAFEGHHFLTYSGERNGQTIENHGYGISIQDGLPGLVFRYMMPGGNGTWVENTQMGYQREVQPGNAVILRDTRLQVYFFDGTDYLPVSTDELEVSGVIELVEDSDYDYTVFKTLHVGEGALSYTASDGDVYSIKVNTGLPFFGYYTSTTRSEETYLPNGFTVTEDSNVFYFVGTEGCTISDFTWEGEGVTAELSEDGSYITFTVDKDADFEGQHLLTYSGEQFGWEFTNNGYGISIQDGLPGLVFRFMWNNENGQLQEAVEYVRSWNTAKGYSANVKVYFFDGESYTPLGIDDLSDSNNGVVSLTVRGDADYITMIAENFGNGTVNYTDADGNTYDIDVNVSLPDFGFYTSTTRSEETYLPYGFTVTKDSNVFYFVGTEGCTFSDFTWKGEGVTAELSEDGSYITFTVDKDADFEGYHDLRYSGERYDWTFENRGAGINIKNGLPGLFYRSAFHNMDGTLQEFERYEQAFSCARYDAPTVAFYLFDGEKYERVGIDQLKCSDNIELLECESDANYVDIFAADWGEGWISYTDADGEEYKIETSVVLPNYSFYSTDTASEESYIRNHFSASKDVKEFYFVGLPSCTIGDYSFAAENSGIVTAERISDNCIKFTLVKESDYDGFYDITYSGEKNGEPFENWGYGIFIDHEHLPADAVSENVVDATCEAGGSYDEVVYCSVCGVELVRENISIDALGHDEVAHAAKAPTCTEFGWDAYVTCTRCDYSTYNEIPAKGHTEEEIPAVAPDCTATGLTAGIKCSVCGEILKAQETVAAKGHTEEEIPAVAPGCTTTGLTAGTKCSVCGEILKAQEEVAATGHSYDDGVVTTKPTCTENGVKTYTCTACGHSYTETVDALGHTDANNDYICDVCDAKLCDDHEEETIPAVAPTCTATGLTAGTKCSKCGEILVAQETVAALGHDEVAHAAKAPTCTEFGWDAYVTCSRCDYTTYKEILAKGHSEEEIPAVAPDCTETGLTAGIKCSVCGEILKAQEEVAATGHTEEEIPAAAPGCTATGLTAGTKCSVCGDILKAQEEVAATGHSYDDGVVTTKPTCTETGVKTYTCTACGHSYTETVDALGHSDEDKNYICDVCDAKLCDEHVEEVIPAVAPTCENTGLAEGKKCSKCGEILKAQETVAALGHDEVDHAAKAPTCTEHGWDAYVTCSRCDYSTYNEIPAKGHTEEEIPAVAPDCTATGLTAGIKCSVCGEILKAQETVAAKGHTEEEIPAVAPGCTATGLTAGTKCSVCGDILKAQEEVAALGHTAADAVRENEKAATCIAEGSYDEVVYCSVCKEELSRETKTIDKLTKHTPGEPVRENVVDATYEAEGSYDEVIYCVHCKVELSREQKVIDKLVPVLPSVPSAPSAPSDEPESGTTENEDGSITTTVVDKETGKVTETTETTNGVTGTIVTDKEGNVEEIKVEIPVDVNTDRPVMIPVKVSAADKPEIQVVTNNVKPVIVNIPVEDADNGTVAVVVDKDGKEKVIQKTVLTDYGISVPVNDGEVIRIVDNSKQFDDVDEGAWYSDAIDFASAREIVNGMGNGCFEPNTKTTRAMVWTMLARLEGVDTSSGATWYEAGQKWAMENGISDGTNASAEITREQLATMLWRYIGEPEVDGNLGEFSDGHMTSEWAKDAKEWAVSIGLIEGMGDGTLNPGGEATRAQIATIFARLIANIL